MFARFTKRFAGLSLATLGTIVVQPPPDEARRRLAPFSRLLVAERFCAAYSRADGWEPICSSADQPLFIYIFSPKACLAKWLKTNRSEIDVALHADHLYLVPAGWLVQLTLISASTSLVFYLEPRWLEHALPTGGAIPYPLAVGIDPAVKQSAEHLRTLLHRKNSPAGKLEACADQVFDLMQAAVSRGKPNPIQAEGLGEPSAPVNVGGSDPVAR